MEEVVEQKEEIMEEIKEEVKEALEVTIHTHTYCMYAEKYHLDMQFERM